MSLLPRVLTEAVALVLSELQETATVCTESFQGRRMLARIVPSGALEPRWLAIFTKPENAMVDAFAKPHGTWLSRETSL